MQEKTVDLWSPARREQQFEQLFYSEYDRMYRAAHILLGNEDEAKDVVQDVFVQLWTGTSPLRKESITAFLLTCVRNRCLNIIAHRQTEQKAMQLLTPETVDEGSHDDELVEVIKTYIDEQLTPQTSRIIQMRYYEEQSYKEISQSLGVSLSAINKHIVQGMRKLRSTFKNKEA
ncbi:sigma-70 family RNA polymerase sigma factor [Prevotella sp. lc2012]|jgi:RNA polymerase sigma-70 factor (ECF subfamily)|uniref:sigma-70 family RNA polymerase sigma factor n=1 Tax=Prevotella sp. lc2012 TaxID=1761886 RepID=UPI0008973933|nr:sigma-70 family RNA polymerase sigma factor [Prevotella sp. lc2012]MBR5989773.1 sigma-70 family RNA polymerase sigma factor [Prevotella sp.]SEE58571.1 RNA polymerase sigma-70 factor, ECF subfamily [Prevotella sp. lc2012]